MTWLWFDRAGPRAARIRNRVGVAAASIALYWGPWGADRWLRGDHSPWLVLPVVIMRECAVLAGIAGILALCARPTERQGRTRVSPEVGQLATP
jgi:hypothetical protein